MLWPPTARTRAPRVRHDLQTCCGAADPAHAGGTGPCRRSALLPEVAVSNLRWRRRPVDGQPGSGVADAWPATTATATTGVGTVNRIAAALACGAVLFASAANADPDTDVLICSLLLLGQTPGQIAETLHQAAPTFTRQQAINRVWTTLPTCSNTLH